MHSEWSGTLYGLGLCGKSAETSASQKVHDGLTVERLISAVMRAEESGDSGDEQPEELTDEEIDYALGGYPDPQYERNGRY